MSGDDVEPTRHDGRLPDASSAPLTEDDQEKPIHKMFFDPKMDAEAIADIIWESRDKAAWDAKTAFRELLEDKSDA